MWVGCWTDRLHTDRLRTVWGGVSSPDDQTLHILLPPSSRTPILKEKDVNKAITQPYALGTSGSAAGREEGRGRSEFAGLCSSEYLWVGWAGKGTQGFTDRRIFDSWWTDEFRHGSVSRKRQGQMETHSLSLILIFSPSFSSFFFFFCRRSEFPNSLKCFNASRGIIFPMPLPTYS